MNGLGMMLNQTYISIRPETSQIDRAAGKTDK
jgi:hypothetical protein